MDKIAFVLAAEFGAAPTLPKAANTLLPYIAPRRRRIADRLVVRWEIAVGRRRDRPLVDLVGTAL